MKSRFYLKFTGRYLVRVVTLLIAVSIVSFILVSLSPVDPVQQYVGAVPNVSVEQREKIAEYWGLNDPPAERFMNWGKALLHGDFGTSLIYRRPVADIIKDKFSASLALDFFRTDRICNRVSDGNISWKMAGQNFKKIMSDNVFNTYILDRNRFLNVFFCETWMVSDGNECTTGSCS